MKPLLIHNLAEIATPMGSTAQAGEGQGRVERLRGYTLLIEDGRIQAIGSEEEVVATLDGDYERLDGRGGTLIPGFVDPHTHLPWGGSREEEFSMRLAGKSYQEISAAGGGILSTVRATRNASQDELAALVRQRLDRMLTLGTTTAEAKSGYGLTLDDELKQLRAIVAGAADHPIDVVPTLMAAHEFPPEHRDDRERYVDLICDEIVPAVAESGLARYTDVFCEKGVFDPAQSRKVLEAGRRHGLEPRLHADEFVDSGGAELAAALGAVTADHLIAISDVGVDAMANAGITATLLPGTCFFLMKQQYAPARKLIEAGVPVALATDYNPGSSHTPSIPMVVVLAVLKLGMTIEEALTAVTLNAACTLGLGDQIGSVEIGKRADLLLLDAPNLLHLVYRFGVNPVRTVIKNGAVIPGGVGVQATTAGP